MLSERRSVFLITLIMMSSVGLFATDIYLPSLPEMTQYFNCSQSDIQASFTVFLLGLASCQLVYGILADRFGRKRILIFALTLFVLASLLCAFAQTLTQFIFFRFLQALGGGSGSVISRAIVINRYSRTEAVKVFSTIFPVIGLSGAIAPLIGGYLTYFFDWRSNFYFMALFGSVSLGLVLALLPKTTAPLPLANDTNNSASQVTPFKASQYLDVLKNVPFLGYAFVLCTGFAVFRCYTVESPFVFDNQGYVVEDMAHFYIGLSIAYFVGNLIAKRLVNFRSVNEVIRMGFYISALGCFGMIISIYYFANSPYAVIIPMSVITLANGFLFPTGSAGALSSIPPAVAGMASGVMGFLQFVTAALCVHWIGSVCQGDAQTLSLYLGSIIAVGMTCFWFFVYPKKDSAVSTETSET